MEKVSLRIRNLPFARRDLKKGRLSEWPDSRLRFQLETPQIINLTPTVLLIIVTYFPRLSSL